MKKLFVFFLVLNLSSCAFFEKKKEKDFGILTGEKKTDFLSAEEIKNEVMREDTMAVRSMKIKLFPLLDAYLKKAGNEKELLEDLPTPSEKTCFMAEIRIDNNNKKSADLNTWKAEAINEEGEFIHMDWTSVSKEKSPSEVIIGGYTGQERRYENKGILCAVDKMTLNRFFQVKLSPQVVQWPLKEDVVFTWNVPVDTLLNGKIVKKKRKKKIEKYRGW